MAEGKAEFRPAIYSAGKKDRVGKPMSRRKFLGVAAGAGVAAFSASTLGRMLFGALKKSDESSEVKISLGPKQQVAQLEPVKIATESKRDATPFEVVFEGLTDDQKKEAAEIVATARDWIRRNPHYRDMVRVTKQYEKEIRQMAQEINFPLELALAIILIENRGGIDEISDAGARGITQLMPETAKEYGLRVEENWREGGIDERRDPIKSIGAMGGFLKDHLGKFQGNLGLTLWSYHGGIGNVYRALSIYAQESEGVEFGDLRDEKDRLGKYNVHQVVSHPVVQRDLISKLEDESDLYAYKAVAAAELFEKEKQS